MSYAFDPEIQPWVSMIPPLDISDLDAARAMVKNMTAAAPPFLLPAGLNREERSIPGTDGNPDVPVLIFSPVECVNNPAMIYLHGGGFVMGDAEGDQALPAEIALATSAVVISVDYRIAPEHPFPAGLHDGFTALKWAAENAAELGVDASRIAVGGVSAGAGLAAGIALLARDQGGPQLCFQMLDIPELDDTLSTPSMQQFTDTPLWNLSNGVISWESYLGEHDGAVSPYAAPARATDLRGLPPAYVSVCEFDPLRDEGINYAQRLMQACVPTELHAFPGTFHGSGGAVRMAAVSQRMRAELLEATRRGLGASIKAVTA